MSYIKDFYEWNLTIRKRYWPRELLRLRNYTNLFKWRRQRINRGWSDRDTWGGGEYIAEVCAGILYSLDDDKVTDWEEYFSLNYEENYGYTSLEQVADDLQTYIDWQVIQYQEPYWTELKDDIHLRISLDVATYENAKHAMMFVAQNLGGLWT
jgi:hypothetical protein